MNPKEVLTEHQKQIFKQIPNPREADTAVVHHYTFNQDQLDAIHRHRRDYNRLGFAVQLALVAYPGWSLQQYDTIPDEFIAYIADQLNILPNEFISYALREPTRREHLDEIRRLFGYTSFSKEHYNQLVQALNTPILTCEDPVQAVRTSVDWLRARKIIFPALSTIERAVWETKNQIEKDILQQLTQKLSSRQHEQLDQLLLTGEGTPSLSWLRLASDSYTAEGFLKVADRLMCLKELDLDVTTAGIPATRLKQLESVAESYDATVFSRLKPLKKYGLLALHLHKLHIELTDRALQIHQVIVGQFIRDLARERLSTPKSDKKSLLLSEGFSAEAKKRFKKQYFHLRKYAPLLLSLFQFEGEERAQPLLKAMEALHALYEKGEQHGLIDPSLLSFIPDPWRASVKNQKNVVYRYLFESAVLVELRNLLRDGHLWVAHSKRYGSCSRISTIRSDELDATNQITAYLANREKELAAIVPHISPLPKARIKYKRPPGPYSPPPQTYTNHSLHDQLPKIELSELLSQIDHWTGFTDCFIHASTSKEPDNHEKQRILSILTRLGTLCGLPASQDEREQATYRQLMTTLQWRISAHTLSAAQAKLIEYQDSLSLSRAWGRSSSISYHSMTILDPDGEREGYLCRTMNDTFMIISTHLTFDHHLGWLLAGQAPQGATLLEANVRYCPEQGMSDELFGLARLLGIQLIPRLEHTPLAKLYTIGPVDLPPFAKTGFIQTDKIRSSAAALTHLQRVVGEQQISVPLLYQKLRANAEAREAIREIGRIEKTLFTGEFMGSHELHQAIREDQVRWQAMDQLTQSLCRGIEWHVRRDESEEYSLAILALSLITNAITVWNTVQLEKLLHRMDDSVDDKRIEVGRGVSPLYGKHIQY